MADYQAMYTALFRKVTTIIEELQNVQRETEEIYISSEPANIKVFDADKIENETPDLN